MKVSMCVHEQGLAGTQGSPMVREDITNIIWEKQDEAESTAPYGTLGRKRMEHQSCRASVVALTILSYLLLQKQSSVETHSHG